MANEFDKIKVWKKSHELVLAVYKATRDFPSTENSGLTSQIRRAVVSVPSNIVEGYKRGSKKEFLRFLCISNSSLEEVKYQLFLAKDLKYLKKDEYKKLSESADEVGRMLSGFQKSLKT